MLVVDTSVWVAFFRGEPRPALEDALRVGLVVLPPIVVAELMSAPLRKRQHARLAEVLEGLPLQATPFAHWRAVGELRARLARAGLSVSSPDAHVAQCALDLAAPLWSHDAIFARIAALAPLRLVR